MAEGEQLNSWYREVARFLILTNAGGAVATSSFLGSSIATGHPLKWALLPLALFVIGLCAAGGIGLGQLTYHWTRELSEGGIGPEAQRFALSRKVATRLGAWLEANTGTVAFSSIVCFALGCAIAIFIISLA